MRITLRRLREAKGWKINYAAQLYHMGVEKLRSYENYKDIPTFEELAMMLKMMGYYFDEITFIIWRDIEEHYQPKNEKEFSLIDNNITHCFLEWYESERNN